MDDVIDRVFITPNVIERWVAVARDAVRKYHLDPSQVPNERARVEPDGRLVIFVELPDGMVVSMDVSPSEWRWATGMH